MSLTARDKQQSILQGHSCRLRLRDSSIPTSFIDDYDELQPFDTLTYAGTPRLLSTPTRSVSCSEQLCKLSIIAETILESLYSEQSYTRDATDLLCSSGSLQAELDHWKTSLPRHLSLQPGQQEEFDVLPHTLTLV